MIGCPLYGRAFTNTSGLGQPFQGVGEGSWDQGVWDYKVLPKPGAKECWDDEAKASFSYDESARTLVSYDSKRAAEWKARWLKHEGLGGAMWWEPSGDRQGDGSLISSVCALLPVVTCVSLIRRKR